MLNEERIKLMTKMAAYEADEGRKMLQLVTISGVIILDYR